MRARLVRRVQHAAHVSALNRRPLKFVTLTYAHDVPRKDLLKHLARLLQILRKRYHRVEYVRFPEYTKRGRYHLHLIMLAPYISARNLSKAWRSATRTSYVVHIRAVRNSRDAVRYATKYTTKDPAAKITFSRNFPIPPDMDEPQGHDDTVPPPFTYAYRTVLDAALEAKGAPQLWTGEPIYWNGPCCCWPKPPPP